MRTTLRLVLGTAVLSCLPVLAGCNHSATESDSPASTSAAPSTKAVQVTTPTHTKTKTKTDSPSTSGEPSTSGAPSSSATPSSSWTMPDVKGKNLLQAKLDIRDLVGDLSRPIKSKDLTDQDRHPHLDFDWQVCNSTPAAGETFTSDTDIELGVVRKSETCPEQQ